ncbi:MAG: TolC family protein [Bacteroidales bacterium]|nr:TolC family protein [Bacteroidales bacterium]
MYFSKNQRIVPSFQTVVLVVSILFGRVAFCQQEHKIFRLEDVVAVAHEKSVDAFRAKHRYRGSYWQYRSYRAGYLPQVSLEASLPNLNRSISPITLPDGSDIFISRSLATSNANLSISQNIGLTGGRVFINSGLQRIDLIRDSIVTSYSSTPVSIGFSQPLFGFNTFKWERKIEPLQFEEANRQFVEDMENVAIKATNYFFDLLNAQINIGISEINYSNNDTLYKIALGRYNLGKIAENELLEMELNLLNAHSSLEQKKIDYQAALMKFRSYLGINGNEEIELMLPLDVPNIQVNAEKAVAEALKNRPDVIALNKNIIEADREVARAKSENRFNVNLFGSYGLAQSAQDFNGVYLNPLDQQQLVIGIQIPLIDWGVSKGRIKMAESFKELTKTNVAQAIIDFEQEIYLKTLNFNMLNLQLNIASKADTVALKRYEVTKQRFLIGRIDIISLNLAQEAKDLATQSYVSALRNFWVAYYEMRRLTHYDFLTDTAISFDLRNLEK